MWTLRLLTGFQIVMVEMLRTISHRRKVGGAQYMYFQCFPDQDRQAGLLHWPLIPQKKCDEVMKLSQALPRNRALVKKSQILAM